jgi:MoaA/NifB/PqqE/SkfB family radical SAM enzyme
MSDASLPTLEIPLTEACNNRCGFCTTAWFMIEKRFEPSDLSRDAIRERLARGYASGARRVVFHGGEPTRRRDLGEVVDDARGAGFEQVVVFTHARAAATEEGARWLGAMAISSFFVSIQGGTAEAHDEAVGVPGAFAETVAGARRLIGLGRRVKVNGVLTRPLLDTLDAYAKLMIDLGPEEVGLDTLKPTGAFEDGRASYARLCPKLSPHAAALREALAAMERAGITARLTTFPPCLVPGAEHLVANEPPTVTSIKPIGKAMHKLVWVRDMQVKAEACARCAYDGDCGGVYGAYAEAHGLDEIVPLERRRKPDAAPEPAPDVPLTRALRALFVRAPAAGSTPAPRFGVREIRRRDDGTHELSCFGPGGEISVLLGRRGASPAYATTARFGVRYAGGGGARDLRIVDAVVGSLRRAEGRLPPDDASPEPASAGSRR